jgi:hypothetical protein
MAVTRSGDSEIPDLDNGLWERIRDAVQVETGADKSLWKGQLDYTSRPNIRGSASSDGVMRLNDDMVVKPLQEMYETRGEPATPEQWTQRRNALKTATHEFTHLASPQDHTYADRRAGMQHPEFKPIEEGVTEAYSQSAVNNVADRALPQDLADEIKAAKNAPRSYPGWEPAARSFADQVGAETGEDGDEVLRRMAAEPRTGKARAAADMMFEASDLPDLVPAEQQEAVRQEIADDIDKGFADLQPLNGDTSVNRRSVSRQRGLEIADSATDVVRAAEERYRGGPEQQQQREASQEASRDETDLSALPPPNAADRIPTTPQQQPVSFAQQSPAQQQARLQQAESQRPEQGRQGATGQDQDLVAMRAAFGGQAPAAGSPRVAQGQAAEGRRPNTHAAGPAAARTTDTPSR